MLEAKRPLGKLIEFEYVDGGKPQDFINFINEEFFPNDGMVFEKEPTDGIFGGPIKNLLNDDPEKEVPNWRVLAHGFLADRYDHINKNTKMGIKKCIENGVTYICDRYNLSTYAYQVPYEEFEWLFICSKEIIIPDLTIFLRYDLDVCYKNALSALGDAILFRKAKGDANKFKQYLKDTENMYLRAIQFLSKKPGWQNTYVIDVESNSDAWEQIKPLVKSILRK
jgi:thymidylate kinase